MSDYYNYQHHLGNDLWFRYSFLAHLWGAYKNDPHWSPPEYQVLRSAVMTPHPHIARQHPIFIHSHAIRRPVQDHIQKNDWLGQGSLQNLAQEETIGLAVALHDPRRSDQAAGLACLRIANQPECLEQVLSELMEASHSHGFQRIIGPIGFSYHLGSGLLVDHWQETPPLYTAYAPPYMVETVLSVMEPIQTSRLYHLPVPEAPVEACGPAELARGDLPDLTSGLLHLFQTAVKVEPLAVELDELEADFLLHWISSWPTYFWTASIQGQPAGFALLQPDLSPRLQRSSGGRWPWWRLWLRFTARGPVQAGRILFGGVLPEARRRGLGSQLLAKSLQTAQELGWQELTIGPIPDNSPAAQFLAQHGTQPRQTYQTFEWS